MSLKFLSTQMGTSVAMIDKHYGHVELSEIGGEIAKKSVGNQAKEESDQAWAVARRNRSSTSQVNTRTCSKAGGIECLNGEVLTLLPANRWAFRSGSLQTNLLDNLPEPDELAEEIIENLEAGLMSFREVLSGLERAS